MLDRELTQALDSLAGVYQDSFDRLASAQRSTAAELGGRIDGLEARLNRPGVLGGGAGGGNRQQRSPEMADWETFLRRGPDAVERRNALQISDDTLGGYLAPEAFEADLARNVVLHSPIRALARVTRISASAVQLPRRTGTLTGSWVGETQTRPETGPTYGQDRFDVREAACYVDVSKAMVEDSAFDILAELSLDFAEEFGRLEGAAFTNGSAPMAPEGFMVNPDVPSRNSGAATALTADGLIDLYHALPAPYRGNAVWGMNAKTLGSVRKLKTGDGQYLLSMAGLQGAPATAIFGRPVVEMPDLPDEGAGSFPVIFADFMQFYRIFDRMQLSVLVDPLTQATQGLNRYHARRRVAGGVRKAEAGIKLKCAA